MPSLWFGLCAVLRFAYGIRRLVFGLCSNAGYAVFSEGFLWVWFDELFRIVQVVRDLYRCLPSDPRVLLTVRGGLLKILLAMNR